MNADVLRAVDAGAAGIRQGKAERWRLRTVQLYDLTGAGSVRVADKDIARSIDRHRVRLGPRWSGINHRLAVAARATGRNLHHPVKPILVQLIIGDEDISRRIHGHTFRGTESRTHGALGVTVGRHLQDLAEAVIRDEDVARSVYRHSGGAVESRADRARGSTIGRNFHYQALAGSRNEEIARSVHRRSGRTTQGVTPSIHRGLDAKGRNLHHLLVLRCGITEHDEDVARSIHRYTGGVNKSGDWHCSLGAGWGHLHHHVCVLAIGNVDIPRCIHSQTLRLTTQSAGGHRGLDSRSKGDRRSLASAVD